MIHHIPYTLERGLGKFESRVFKFSGFLAKNRRLKLVYKAKVRLPTPPDRDAFLRRFLPKFSKMTIYRVKSYKF